MSENVLLETICLKNGVFQHLAYHQARMERSCVAAPALATALPAFLEQNFAGKEIPLGTFKCRVLYHTQIEKIVLSPYLPQPPQTLQVVKASIKYDKKYANRSALEALQAGKDEADDILIVNPAGFITDTSYCNIAFFDGNSWYTPKFPLLAGTTRARLLENRTLIEENLHLNDLSRLVSWRVFNAMLDFETIAPLPISHIFLPKSL